METEGYSGERKAEVNPRRQPKDLWDDSAPSWSNALCMAYNWYVVVTDLVAKLDNFFDAELILSNGSFQNEMQLF